MIPRRYVIATLFIAALLVLLAVVLGPRGLQGGGGSARELDPVFALDRFETLAEFPLRDGWSPRFVGAVDPDQPDPWPFPGGFGAPWEPPSPYLADLGLALNGQDGRSEVVLWRGLEWRHYRFEAPLVSARLETLRRRHLLVTLQVGEARFETRLMEIPEGRVLWATDSGPWSRFSWDGRAVLTGVFEPGSERRLLLSTLPVEGEAGERTLAPWDEPQLAGPPRGWLTREAQLWQGGQDLKGHRILVPWGPGARLWFPRGDRLWVSEGGQWTLWGLGSGLWRREATGPGILAAMPPLAMGLVVAEGEGGVRKRSSLEEAQWEPVAPEVPPWPATDPAWAFTREGGITAWDLRWGTDLDELPKERQRDVLRRVYRPEWKLSVGVRSSVAGWLPQGPEVAVREPDEVAWIWVGTRVLLVQLPSTVRSRKLKSLLGSR